MVTREVDIDRFKLALREKGLTPEACAPRIGVGRNTPRRWLKGDIPMLDKAQRLADLLELSVDDLWPIVKAQR